MHSAVCIHGDHTPGNVKFTGIFLTLCSPLKEVIRWAMHKFGVEECLVSAVMSMYTDAKTVVRTVYGYSNCFKVDMHQESALSPLLFVTVTKVLSREFRVALSWEMLYADDLVVIAETKDDLIRRLNKWKDNIENRGM